MKLTQEEKDLISKIRATKKAEQEANSPKFVGYAKEDLFSIDTETLKDIIDGMFGWYPSKSDINEIIDQVFDKAVPAGTKFLCYVENNKESWYDSIYGIEDMDADWARKHLRDIKPYKSK